jgi:hypothetical protein
VSPLDGVNGVRRDLLARIGLSVGCPASGARGRREDAAVVPRPPFQPITRLWQFEGLSVRHGPLFEPCPPKAKVTRPNRVGVRQIWRRQLSERYQARPAAVRRIRRCRPPVCARRPPDDCPCSNSGATVCAKALADATQTGYRDVLSRRNNGGTNDRTFVFQVRLFYPFRWLARSCRGLRWKRRICGWRIYPAHLTFLGRLR